MEDLANQFEAFRYWLENCGQRGPAWALLVIGVASIPVGIAWSARYDVEQMPVEFGKKSKVARP